MAENTRTALVVDDESTTRDFLRAILESIDWNVIEAPDGKTALSMALEQKPQLIHHRLQCHIQSLVYV